MDSKNNHRILLLTSFVTFACHPDCDWEAELARLMVDGTVDCGAWDRQSGDDELLQCASDAESTGSEFRFDFDIELGHATGFSRKGKIYTAGQTDKFSKTDDGISVYACPESLPDALDEIRQHGLCQEKLCNVCPTDQECHFTE